MLDCSSVEKDMFAMLVQRDEVAVPFYVQPATVRHTPGRPEILDRDSSTRLWLLPKAQMSEASCCPSGSQRVQRAACGVRRAACGVRRAVCGDSSRLQGFGLHGSGLAR